MTKLEMAKLGREFHDNYYKKYDLPVMVEYKYGGKMRTRKEYRMTEEGKKINEILKTPMFRCPICKKLVSFNELEVWDQSPKTIAHNEVECSMCYESYMGDDL